MSFTKGRAGNQRGGRIVRKFLIIVVLTVFPIASHGASIHSDATCSKFWNKLSSDAKVMWFHGYATAVANLEVVGTMAGEKEIVGVFRDHLLPKRQRIETVILEINAFCGDYKNRDMPLINVMQHVVVILNKGISP